MFNNENVTRRTDWYRAKTVRAVNGKKVILYIADDAVRHILRQLKANGGQITETTAKAIGMTVANSLKWDDNEFQLDAKEEHDGQDQQRRLLDHMGLLLELRARRLVDTVVFTEH